VKRRVFLLATLALVGVVAFAAGSVASAKPALVGSAAGATRASCSADRVGDAGARPTSRWCRSGPSGRAWRSTCGLPGRPSSVRTGGSWSASTPIETRSPAAVAATSHHRFAASLSGTDLLLTIARGDVRAQSSDFSVASLREQADLAPGKGLAACPGGPSSRCGYASRAPTLPARWSAPRTTPQLERRSQT
jgi:hypothetical protein